MLIDVAENFRFSSKSINRHTIIRGSERDSIQKRIQFDPQFKGTIVRSLANVVHLNKNVTSGRPFTICKEVFITIPDVIYTRKNFYLLDALDEKIHNLKAAGLIELWHSQDLDEKFWSHKVSGRVKPFTLQQLFGCFQILLAGYMMSVIVFLFELSRRRIFAGLRNLHF